MLADSIAGQLVVERQRTIHREADTNRLGRQVGQDGRRRGPTRTPMCVRRLRTAATVRIRPIAPADAVLLNDGFAELSSYSRRLRFFIAKNGLTPAELKYFTDVDHHDHEALVAVTRFGGKGLAVARYIRDPRDHDAAELAVTVIDDWQARGLGTALTTRLAAA